MTRRRWAAQALTHAVLLAAVMAVLYPVVWTAAGSVKSEGEIYRNAGLVPERFTWANYLLVIRQANFTRYMLNSVTYTTIVVAGVVTISSMAAYGFARLRFRGREGLYAFILGLLIMPAPGAFIPLYALIRSLSLLNTRLGYILPLIAAGLPFAIFILRGYFEGVPREIEEAARIDGAGRLRTFGAISLPLVAPALATVAVFTGLSVWNEFFLALLFLSDEGLMPIQRALFVFQGQYLTRYEPLMAGTVLAMLPVVGLYLAASHRITAVMGAGVKG